MEDNMKKTFAKLALGLLTAAVLSSCANAAHYADYPYSPSEQPVYFKGQGPEKLKTHKTRTAEIPDTAQ